MKPDKVLCCRFLFAFLVLTVQKKKKKKTIDVYSVLRT